MFIERKFCELSEYVQYKKITPLRKSTDVFKWDWVDLAHAHDPSTFKLVISRLFEANMASKDSY